MIKFIVSLILSSQEFTEIVREISERVSDRVSEVVLRVARPATTAARGFMVEQIGRAGFARPLLGAVIDEAIVRVLELPDFQQLLRNAGVELTVNEIVEGIPDDDVHQIMEQIQLVAVSSVKSKIISLVERKRNGLA